MGLRREGRILAVQLLYRYGAANGEPGELCEYSWMDARHSQMLSAELKGFVQLLVHGTVEKLEDIDRLITQHLEHWDISRVRLVDLAILRMSVYCLVYQESIPASVTINEAVDIARQFGTEDSYRFVNGILDAIHQQQSS